MPHQLTKEDLANLERAMREAGAPVVGEFRPGASSERLDDAAEEIGLPLPPQLRLWWEWHDGVAVGESGAVEPLYPQGPQMLSLREALETYRSYREAAKRSADPALAPPWDHPDHLFRPFWVPILSASHAAIFVCDASDGATCPVLCIDPQYEEVAAPQTASLGELVTWIRQAYEAGVWWRDADGVWHWRQDRVPPERQESAPDLF
jgi:cell wall assembly regulator SMI1